MKLYEELELQLFPYDLQDLHVIIESRLDIEECVFVPNMDRSNGHRAFSMMHVSAGACNTHGPSIIC